MKILLFNALLFSMCMHAQVTLRQTLSMAGGLSNANVGAERYVLYQSIGQGSVINTFTIEAQDLRQGFVQPLGPATLEDTSLQLSLILYPNPFVNGFTIDFDEEIIEDIDISLFDMMGRRVFAEQYATSQSLSVPIGGIAAGGYLVTIQSGDRKNVKQIVKF